MSDRDGVVMKYRVYKDGIVIAEFWTSADAYLFLLALKNQGNKDVTVEEPAPIYFKEAAKILLRKLLKRVSK